MHINFGKHKGKSSHEVLVKQSAYVRHVLGEQGLTGPLARLQDELRRLIPKIDAKPFAGSCSAPGCVRPPTRSTAYVGDDASLYLWCADCDPGSMGAERGKLQVVLTYADALRHVLYNCGGTTAGYNRMGRAYAVAKGLPKRVSSATARAFLEGQ